jgi:thiol-disulfide isomerase/thioredoxin
MLTTPELARKHAAGLSFDDYVATGSPHQRDAWRSFLERVELTEDQSRLLAGFTREVNAIVLSGTWCGDCVQQAPFLARFAEASGGRFRPRFLDRDAHADLAERVMISAGLRVPVVIYLNEDFDFISLFGDRSLSRYRALAARSLGAACPLPGAHVDGDEVRATQQDWLDELERVHLLCRLSPKLRARHGD